MRRLSLLVGLSFVLTASLALAQEDDGGEGGGRRHNAFKAPGGLLDRSVHQRDMEITAQVGLPWYWWGFPIGLSGRFYWPIVADGFISSLNDEFGLEAGVDFLMVIGGAGVDPAFEIPAAAKWTFHFTDRWSAFAKLGIGLGLNLNPNLYGYTSVWGYSVAYPVVEVVVGGMYKLNDSLSLRLDLGYPWTKFGLVFAL